MGCGAAGIKRRGQGKASLRAAVSQFGRSTLRLTLAAFPTARTGVPEGPAASYVGKVMQSIATDGANMSGVPDGFADLVQEQTPVR